MFQGPDMLEFQKKYIFFEKSVTKKGVNAL